MICDDCKYRNQDESAWPCKHCTPDDRRFEAETDPEMLRRLELARLRQQLSAERDKLRNDSKMKRVRVAELSKLKAVKEARDALREAMKVHCTCSGFVIMYEGKCCCESGKVKRAAEYRLRQAIDAL